jgi:phosphoserine aminotransferase
LFKLATLKQAISYIIYQNMISFYPGPSRIYDEIPKYVKEAHASGILSMNHRSAEFMSLCSETISLLKKKLFIPANYTVLFTTSATECWEIIAQSLIQTKSTHIYNGAFGDKWYQYTKRLKANTENIPFDKDIVLKPGDLYFQKSDLICLTQNETSNGTQVSNSIINSIKKKNQHALIAVDATSSMAGIELNFRAADVWFASVQKCFGLPAGLAVMICSPHAIARMRQLNEKDHYNSLSFMYEMIEKNQTVCTPNVLGIYLLMRVLKKSANIKTMHRRTVKQAERWFALFQNTRKFSLLIANPKVRSHTVICVTGQAQEIYALKQKAKRAGFLLGEGYGELKNDTFRIANFPAIKNQEIKLLTKFFSSYK